MVPPVTSTPAPSPPRRALVRRQRRQRHVVVLAGASLVAGLLAWSLLPGDTPRSQRLSLIFGYESLAAVLGTLTLGPLKVLRRRPNPISSDLRRDVGLWAGLTGVAHVVFSLLHHFGGDPVRYFFTTSPALSSIRRDTFGDAVWIGLAAALVLVGLAAISNDLSLRKLGRRWKTIQRANYALAVVLFAHTVLFWQELDRNVEIRVVTLFATGAVLVLQLSGVAVVLRSTHRRSTSP